MPPADIQVPDLFGLFYSCHCVANDSSDPSNPQPSSLEARSLVKPVHLSANTHSASARWECN